MASLMWKGRSNIDNNKDRLGAAFFLALSNIIVKLSNT